MSRRTVPAWREDESRLSIDDAELGQSRQADDASSPNFYVSNLRGVRGQVKIYDIDEDQVEPSYPEPVYDEPYRQVTQRDPFAEALSDALTQVMGTTSIAASPRPRLS